MKKLVVCGDSYMAAVSQNQPGAGFHFTEILAKKIGWELITFAKGACSNNVIRLQIDEAINENPDFIILNATGPDRFEFPINTKNDYVIENKLYNILYKSTPDKSSEHKKFYEINPSLISETINNIFSNTSIYINYFNKSEIENLKYWFERFYNSKYKWLQDQWILADGIRRIKDNNINFAFICSGCDSNLFSFCEQNIIRHNSNLDPTLFPHESSPNRFHTPIHTQEKIANNWISFFREKNIIN